MYMNSHNVDVFAIVFSVLSSITVQFIATLLLLDGVPRCLLSTHLCALMTFLRYLDLCDFHVVLDSFHLCCAINYNCSIWFPQHFHAETGLWFCCSFILDELECS